MDAFLRDYELHVPADCTASRDPYENDAVLAYMKRVLHADIAVAEDVDLETLRKHDAKT